MLLLYTVVRFSPTSGTHKKSTITRGSRANADLAPWHGFETAIWRRWQITNEILKRRHLPHDERSEERDREGGSLLHGMSVKRGDSTNAQLASTILPKNNYSFDALQAYCFGINIKL